MARARLAQPTLFEKFCNEDFEQGIIIANNCTETILGQQLLSRADVLCFPAGRVNFLDADLRAIGAPIQGQMIVGRDVD